MPGVSHPFAGTEKTTHLSIALRGGLKALLDIVLQLLQGDVVVVMLVRLLPVIQAHLLLG